MSGKTQSRCEKRTLDNSQDTLLLQKSTLDRHTMALERSLGTPPASVDATDYEFMRVSSSKSGSDPSSRWSLDTTEIVLDPEPSPMGSSRKGSSPLAPFKLRPSLAGSSIGGKDKANKLESLGSSYATFCMVPPTTRKSPPTTGNNAAASSRKRSASFTSIFRGSGNKDSQSRLEQSTSSSADVKLSSLSSSNSQAGPRRKRLPSFSLFKTDGKDGLSTPEAYAGSSSVDIKLSPLSSNDSHVSSSRERRPSLSPLSVGGDDKDSQFKQEKSDSLSNVEVSPRSSGSSNGCPSRKLTKRPRRPSLSEDVTGGYQRSPSIQEKCSASVRIISGPDWAWPLKPTLFPSVTDISAREESSSQQVSGLLRRLSSKRSLAILSRPPRTSSEVEPTILRSGGFTAKDFKQINCADMHPYSKDEVPYPLSYHVQVLQGEQHLNNALFRLLGGPSFHPFESEPTRVLDLGAGSGCWIASTAEVWQDTLFEAFDIMNVKRAPLDPKQLRRIHCSRGNILLMPQKSGQFVKSPFNHIHVADMALAVPKWQWENVFETLALNLEPGGILEVIEHSWTNPQPTGDRPEGLEKIYLEMIHERGLDYKQSWPALIDGLLAMRDRGLMKPVCYRDLPHGLQRTGNQGIYKRTLTGLREAERRKWHDTVLWSTLGLALHTPTPEDPHSPSELFDHDLAQHLLNDPTVNVAIYQRTLGSRKCPSVAERSATY